MKDYPVSAARNLLEVLNLYNPQNEHQKRTPERFAAMLVEMTDRGSEAFDFTVFPASASQTEMIAVGPIPFYTLCVHHVVPFFGNAYIAYVPKDRIVGLSKLARTVKYFAKGLWVQEELTTSIASFLEEQLDPIGVAVLLRAEHLCMTMRGVQSPGTKTVTSEMRGCFADHKKLARSEFFNLVNNGASHA